MSDAIHFHHYDTSPFSEKVRLAFGLKALAWRSVIQPTIMPKPDLTPLTGGYRRIPVMTIGADVYCDTQVILAELDRRAPAAPLGGGLAWAVNAWADRAFFQASVAIIFGEIGDKTPEAFIKDREALSGRPFDIEAMRAAGPPMRGQWRAEAGWIEDQLARSGGPFLDGAAAGLADIAAYMNPWFVASALPGALPGLLSGLDRTRAWIEAVRALGHGARSEAQPSEAIDAARTGRLAPAQAHRDDDPIGARPGEPVLAMADDYGRDAVTGVLAFANAERVAIDREAPGIGPVRVHFPRFGYIFART